MGGVDTLLLVVGFEEELDDELDGEEELLLDAGGLPPPPPPGGGVLPPPGLPGCCGPPGVGVPGCCESRPETGGLLLFDASGGALLSPVCCGAAESLVPVPDEELWWELFTWVTNGGAGLGVDAPLAVTAKLASAAHAVATPTPAAASNAYGARRAPERSSGSPEPSSEMSMRS
ncbi:hypothetical protein [Actinocrispum wychmicini]|uniref:hypothetical protein n=1 Tax=Actinocrispum wychmicini TaxID=1213861 RepID=UPI001053997D|nr:hypothetical protein [Actinocrispum wychmicini]